MLVEDVLRSSKEISLFTKPDLGEVSIRFSLFKIIETEFPNSVHVRELSKTRLKDIEIWNYAKKNSLVIVTYDEDFHDLLLLLDHPPKVIWLRLGNAPTKKIATRLTVNKEAQG